MSAHPIKVLVVDDNEKARDGLIEQLRFADVEVVGESTLGAAAFTWAERLAVDVAVVAIEEPVARALRTVESLTVGTRTWPVLGLSSLGDRETMRKAMVAGVRDFVVAPASGEDLRRAILQAHQVEEVRRAAMTRGEAGARLGTIVTVFGVKGGIGKSVMASNVAVSLAQETKQHVAMLDLDLQFGDAAVMLDIVPARTVEDASKELERMDPQLIAGYLTDHPSRLKLLAAPATPEGAERITPDHVGQILETLASTNDYVVVDTPAQLDPVTMVALDLATMVLLIVTPEVPCVRRTKAVLTLMEGWGYTRDKVKLVVNRTRRRSEVSVAEIAQVLDYPIYAQIPDDRAVTKAISLGTPVAMSGPKTKSGRAIIALGRDLAGLPERPGRVSRFRRRPASEVAAARPTAPPSAPAPAPLAASPSALLDAWQDEPEAPAGGAPPAAEPSANGWNVERERDYWGALLGLSAYAADVPAAYPTEATNGGVAHATADATAHGAHLAYDGWPPPLAPQPTDDLSLVTSRNGASS